MSHTREKVIPEFEFHPARIITLKIDKTLTVMGKSFANAFADGKEKPAGLSLHKLCLFNQVWDELNVDITFIDVKELNKYYDNLAANLEVRLHNYCYEKKLATVEIAHLMMPMQKFIKLYQMLATYRFIIQNHQKSFSSIDRPEKFSKAIAQLKQEHEGLKEAIDKSKEFAFDAIISPLEQTLKKTYEKFQKNGYLPTFKFTADTKASDQNLSSDDVINQLQRLVNINSIAESIDRLTTQKELAQKELRAIIILLEDVKKNLALALQHEINRAENNYTALSMQSAALEVKLTHFKQTIQGVDIFDQLFLIKGGTRNGHDFGKGFKSLAEIGGELIGECNKQIGIQLNLKTNEWHQACHQTKNNLNDLINELDNFTHAYCSHLPIIDQSNATIAVCQEMLASFKDNKSRLLSLITQAKSIKDQASETIEKIQNFLAGNTESNFDFIKTFLKRNGVKLTLGGLSGSGMLATIALSLALNPATLGMATLAGFALGSAAVGGVGLAVDKDQASEPSQALTQKNTDRWHSLNLPHFSLWNKRELPAITPNIVLSAHRKP